MTAKPRSIPLGPLSRYVETFRKDGAPTTWNMRRDIKMGRSTGQMFFTACGGWRLFIWGVVGFWGVWGVGVGGGAVCRDDAMRPPVVWTELSSPQINPSPHPHPSPHPTPPNEGTMIFRVYAKGMFSSEPEYVCEEYSRLEDEGNTIVSRQCGKHFASGRTAVQYLVGDWVGLEPPPGHI
jgi:hypothetical protein